MPRKRAAERHADSAPPTEREPGGTEQRTLRRLELLLANLHPTRARIVRYLAVYGPANVGTLAAALGLAPGSVSHHCKPLHTAGTIEPSPHSTGDARVSTWQVKAPSTQWDVTEFPRQSKARAIVHRILRRLVDNSHAEHLAWLDAHDNEADDWLNAATYSTCPAHMTVDELRDLMDTVHTAIADWAERHPQCRQATDTPDEGRRLVELLVAAHPVTS